MERGLAMFISMNTLLVKHTFLPVHAASELAHNLTSTSPSPIVTLDAFQQSDISSS